MLLSEIWLPLMCCLSKSQQWLLLPQPASTPRLNFLCVPQSSLLSGCDHQRLSGMLCCYQ